MNTSWQEQYVEPFASESASESPFGEQYATEEAFPASPFLSTEDESTNDEADQGEAFTGEYGEDFTPGDSEDFVTGEAYFSEYHPGEMTAEMEDHEWESPFNTATSAEDSEVWVGTADFPNQCGDVRYRGDAWPYKGKPDPRNVGQVSTLAVTPYAEVIEFSLGSFDVDRYELKPAHRKQIEKLVQQIAESIRKSRYTGAPVRVYTYGEASSTASVQHNVPLSRHRAFNVLNAIRCKLTSLRVNYPISYGFYATGEEHARATGPDQREDSRFRGVVVRVIAPLKPCNCRKFKLPRLTRTETPSVCISVPKIAPRATLKLPPDIIPLGSIIPGLKLPVAIVIKAKASVRMDSKPGSQSGHYQFEGWGLEFALPSGQARINFQADLRATLNVLVKASASLAAKLNLGPLKIALRLDASAFAQLIVKLCAQIRARLDIDLGRPNLPELSQCGYLPAKNVQGAFPFPALNGPGYLLVPGRGYGTALLGLAGPGVSRVGLAANPVPVPADKSTVKTLLALAGNLTFLQASGPQREFEYEDTYSEWSETYENLEAELEPFI